MWEHLGPYFDCHEHWELTAFFASCSWLVTIGFCGRLPKRTPSLMLSSWSWARLDASWSFFALVRRRLPPYFCKFIELCPSERHEEKLSQKPKAAKTKLFLSLQRWSSKNLQPIFCDLMGFIFHTNKDVPQKQGPQVQSFQETFKESEPFWTFKDDLRRHDHHRGSWTLCLWGAQHHRGRPRGQGAKEDERSPNCLGLKLVV